MTTGKPEMRTVIPIKGGGGKEYCVNAKTQYAILKQYL